jgi:hypothetical protein
MRVCSICNGKHYAKDFCAKHYKKLYWEKYYQKNKDALRSKRQKWYQDNKRHVNQLNKDYRANNREKVNTWNKEWQRNNREKVSGYFKKYYHSSAENRRKHYIRRLSRNYPLKNVCEFCGGIDCLQKHHYNYKAPENFYTLCRKCHLQEHGKVLRS